MRSWPVNELVCYLDPMAVAGLLIDSLQPPTPLLTLSHINPPIATSRHTFWLGPCCMLVLKTEGKIHCLQFNLPAWSLQSASLPSYIATWWRSGPVPAIKFCVFIEIYESCFAYSDFINPSTPSHHCTVRPWSRWVTSRLRFMPYPDEFRHGLGDRFHPY